MLRSCAMDSLRSLFQPLNPRRVVQLGVFGGLVVLFRHLLMLLVFFVAVERPLGLASRWVARRTGMRRPLALLVVLGLVLALAGIALELGIVSALHAFLAAREALPERIAAFQQTPLFLRIKEYLSGAEGVVEAVEAARHWAAGALSYLATLGHLLLQALIGAVLAVVYLLEQEEIEGFARSLDPRSLPGTLLRWLGYLADAASVTVLIVSLLLWEEMLGFKGLFISFPFLYVATRIRSELHAEAAAESAAA